MAREAKSSPSWGVVIFLLIIFWPVGLYLLFKKISTGDTLGEGKVLRVVGWMFIVIAIVYISLGESNLVVSENAENVESTIEVLRGVGSFFFIGGVIMIIMAKRKRTKANRYRKYIAIVENNRVRQIDSIASAFPTTYEKAHDDLQEMINKGFLEDAYIDESKREIVLVNSVTESNMAGQLQGNQPQYDQSQFIKDPLSQLLFEEQQLQQQLIRGQQPSKQSSQYSQIHVSQTIITNQQPITEQKEPPKKKEPRVVICKNCGGNNKIIDGDIGECEYCGSPIE